MDWCCDLEIGSNVDDCCNMCLSRIFTEPSSTPVSNIMAVAIKWQSNQASCFLFFLTRQNPGAVKEQAAMMMKNMAKGHVATMTKNNLGIVSCAFPVLTLVTASIATPHKNIVCGCLAHTGGFLCMLWLASTINTILFMASREWWQRPTRGETCACRKADCMQIDHKRWRIRLYRGRPIPLVFCW